LVELQEMAGNERRIRTGIGRMDRMRNRFWASSLILPILPIPVRKT
jgi:hypothetical protein